MGPSSGGPPSPLVSFIREAYHIQSFWNATARNSRRLVLPCLAALSVLRLSLALCQELCGGLAVGLSFGGFHYLTHEKALKFLLALAETLPFV